jgi:hypothetical protein
MQVLGTSEIASLPSLRTPTYASVLLSHVNSLLESYDSAVAIITCHAPRAAETTRFALLKEISLS